MKKIKCLFIISAFFLLISNYLFSASLPSGWNELQVGVDGVTSVSAIQIEKYEIKLVSVTATYSDGSSSEIYSNASGSDAVDLVSTTAGTNGLPFVNIGSVPAGTITSIQAVISSSIKVKGYQNFATSSPYPIQQLYTTSSAPSGSYYAYRALNQGSNSGDATIDVSQSPYSVTTQDLTVTVSNLNITVSQDETKKLKLVFDISESLAFGYKLVGMTPYIIAVPGTPTITVDSGETS